MLIRRLSLSLLAVLALVSADGKRVLSAGRIESCMKCHQDAPNDRVFGRPAH
jgi:hypothetical protein